MITGHHERAIVAFIDSWEAAKLGWHDIVAACPRLLGRGFTRQALSRNEDISSAYERKKRRLRLGKTPADRVAGKKDREAELRLENAILLADNDALRVRYVLLSAYASRRGWLPELEAQWPPPERPARGDTEARRQKIIENVKKKVEAKKAAIEKSHARQKRRQLAESETRNAPTPSK